MDVRRQTQRNSGSMLLLITLLMMLLGTTCKAAPQVVFVLEARFEGDSCGDTGVPGGGPGVCRRSSQCPEVLNLTTPVRCGNTVDGNITVCCPQTDIVPTPPPVTTNDPRPVPGGVQNTAIINVDSDSIDYIYDSGNDQGQINTNADYDYIDSGLLSQPPSTADPRSAPGSFDYSAGLRVDNRGAPLAS